MRGGTRPNSGPKKGTKYKNTLEKEAARQVIYDFVCLNMTPILEAMLNKAKGIFLKEEEATYLTAPDPQAAKLLLEHALGKPREFMDLTSKGKQLFLRPDEVTASVLNLTSEDEDTE